MQAEFIVCYKVCVPAEFVCRHSQEQACSYQRRDLACASEIPYHMSRVATQKFAHENFFEFPKLSVALEMIFLALTQKSVLNSEKTGGHGTPSAMGQAPHEA
jgi:hypothetical protein